MGSDKEETMMMMMEALIDYVHDKNFYWFVIYDQYNPIDRHSGVVTKFPLSVRQLWNKRKGNSLNNFQLQRISY